MVVDLWYPEKGKTVETGNRSVVAGGGGERMNLAKPREVCGLNGGLHVIVHLSKLIEDIVPRVNPDVNHGWHSCMCQCGFPSCNKCTVWWGMLIVAKKHCMPVEAGGRESFVPAPLFCSEPKTALKNGLYKNKPKTSSTENWINLTV